MTAVVVVVTTGTSGRKEGDDIKYTENILYTELFIESFIHNVSSQSIHVKLVVLAVGTTFFFVASSIV